MSPFTQRSYATLEATSGLRRWMSEAPRRAAHRHRTKRINMRSLRLFVIACGLGAAGLQAAGREFKGIVRGISDEEHTQPMRLWGLVFVAKAALPFTGTGVSGTDFAIFEDLGARSGSTA